MTQVRILQNGFGTRFNVWKPLLILVVAVLLIVFILRINLSSDNGKGFSKDKRKSNQEHIRHSARNVYGNSKKIKSANDKDSKLYSLSPARNPIDKKLRRNEAKKEQQAAVYNLFQPYEEVEFPTAKGQKPRIPHIIHQMFVNESIPEMYVKHVKSFLKLNPTWEYRFWTDESGRRLLQKHHPYLVKVFDKFGNSVRRSDLLRYAVLYEYGGFYSDLDVSNLRSLNMTTMKYDCVISAEPFEHSVFLFNMAYMINNAIMSCRPKHPFFRLVLRDLKNADPEGHPVITTGPWYLTMKFKEYNRIEENDNYRTKTDWTSNSPYFYKGELMEGADNSVYVPNNQYFMDMLDQERSQIGGTVSENCKNESSLPILRRKACSEFYSRISVRRNHKYTFTIHHWYHLWCQSAEAVKHLKRIHIKDIAPNCILYDD